MKKQILTALMMILVTLSGCIDDTETTDISSSSTDPCAEFSPTIRESNGTLRIITYDIYALSDEVVQQFTNETGIEVEFIRTEDAGGILDQMMLTRNAPQADLMIGLDNTYSGIAIQNCLLASNNFNRSVVDSNLNDTTFGDTPELVPFDHGHICINYDSNYVDGENVTAPTSLWNFTEETWRGKVAFPSAVSSSPGRAFMLATTDYFENDTEWDWWEQMVANDAIITSGWTEAYEVHYTGGYGQWYDGYIGDAHATVSYCHSPGVEAFSGENYTTSVALDLPRASLHQIEYTGIVNGAANVEAANQFIEFLLSEEVNTNMPTNNYMYSVLEGNDLPEENGYRFHSPVPSQSAELDLSEMDIEALVERFAEIVA